MVNMEIVEGLKEAMARGESLKQAMFSFYNAGYGKQEIEDSARYLLQILQAERQRILAQRQIQAEQQKPLNKAKQPLQQQIQQQIPQKQIQKVSNYNQQAKSSKITIILLIFILVILFGALVVMFLFKDKVIELFNNLF